MPIQASRPFGRPRADALSAHAAALSASATPRVNVVGTSGAGKTTFARALAATLEVPHLEMDALYWEPGWTEPTDEVFAARLRAAVAAEAWVLDGNYHRMAPVKWPRATLLVWLDYPLLRILYRTLTRSLRRALSKQELWPGTGNYESLRKLVSRDSVVLWSLRSHRPQRIRYAAEQARPSAPERAMVRLRSPREAEHFLRAVAAARAHVRGHGRTG